MDEIQAEIKEKGGLAPLISLLGDENEILCQQYAAAAIEALARDHHENQIALAKSGTLIATDDLPRMQVLITARSLLPSQAPSALSWRSSATSTSRRRSMLYADL